MGAVMSSKKDWGRKQTGVVWEDLRAWVEQLYNHHGVLVTFTVHLLPDSVHLKPGLTMTAYRPRGALPPVVVRTDWRIVDTMVMGHAAKEGLQMVSKLLLELDNEEWQAEQRSLL